MNDVVEIVDYDPRWPSLFAEERAALAAAAGDGAVIEHVGSTAVPGLAAKPTIDLVIGMARLELNDALRSALGGLGYRHLGELGVPGRQFFRKGAPPTHHVHCVRKDGDVWQKQLLFRDYLRTHPDACELYARLKRELAAEFRNDRSGYTASKGGIVTELLERAWRWKRVPLVVFDLEATCWREPTPPERMETIEFGGVRLGADLEAQAEFQRFVRPSARPTLSEHCRELTSIRQADVDGARSFPQVLAEFAAWVGPPPIRLASWSRYDQRQLEVDCARHAFDLPAALESHLDLQALYAQRQAAAAVPMTRALEELRLAHEGQRHRALDDARNIARIARLLLASP